MGNEDYALTQSQLGINRVDFSSGWPVIIAGVGDNNSSNSGNGALTSSTSNVPASTTAVGGAFVAASDSTHFYTAFISMHALFVSLILSWCLH